MLKASSLADGTLCYKSELYGKSWEEVMHVGPMPREAVQVRLIYKRFFSFVWISICNGGYTCCSSVQGVLT
jgi:hypothetical protein